MVGELYKDTILRIKPIAERFINKNNLHYPINDSLKVLSEMGYFIIKAKAPTNLSGFYMQKDRFPFIFVNSKHSLGRQNFSMWHDVYHHYMQHQNGLSDFGSNLLEEREAEIFAGMILLPDVEIQKWSDLYDMKDKNIIAQMSDYYQMSFNAVVIRCMQVGVITYKTFKQLKVLSALENQVVLNEIYETNKIGTSVIYPTNDIKISANILWILQKNHQNNLIDNNKINDIIEKIEVLNSEK